MAHVKAHYATNKKTGSKYWVKEHDDKRTRALDALKRFSAPVKNESLASEDFGIDPNNIESVPLPSKPDFEKVLETLFGATRQYFLDEDEKPFRSWRDMLARADEDDISLYAGNEYMVFDKLYKIVPPEAKTDIEYHFSGSDLFNHFFNKYKEGKLPAYIAKKAPEKKVLKVEDIPAKDEPAFYKPQPKKSFTNEELLNHWEEANNPSRLKEDKTAIAESRKTIFIAYNTDMDLPKKLGIKPSAINAKMRSWYNYSADAINTQQIFNRGVPEQFEWTGITNSSFINRTSVNLDDVDKFIKEFEWDIFTAGRRSWNGDLVDETIRRYTANVFLAFDTRIDYKDLTIKVGSLKGVVGNSSKDSSTSHPNGLYSNHNKTVTLDYKSENTLAHEITHYLDYKFAEEVGLKDLALSEVNPNTIKNLEISDERKKWVKDYLDFIDDISSGANVSSAYLMEKREIFARFGSKFFDWTIEKAGNKLWNESYNLDKFHEHQHREYVRLLQQRAYLNAKESEPVKKSLILKFKK